MKSILALALFVGVALCNSSAYYGWRPHKEYTYRFESQTLTGIPDIESQYAGLKLVADVKVQSFEDYSLRIKMENPRYRVVNEKLTQANGIPRVPKPETELPESLRRPLTAPFVVHLKRGVVESFFVEENEPVMVTNIKKALLSQLQIDITGSRRPEVVSNHVTKQEAQRLQQELQEGQNGGQNGVPFFATYESTILGDCETSYTINPLPKFQANEVEERIQTSEKQLKEEGVISGERTRGEELCEGKKYWEVVKTQNFDNCKEMPVYQSAAGIKLKCDFSKAQCRDALTHTSTTRYILCGSSPEEFYIREAVTANEIMTNPLGWVASKEKMTSSSKVTLNLLKVEQGSRTPMPKPEQTKTERSLVFQYPKDNLWSSKSSTKALTPGQETDEYGFEPIMPKPGMRGGATILPSPLPISELKQKIAAEMEKAVSEIFKSPESCSSKSDIAGTVSTISYFLRPLSYEKVKEVESHMHTLNLSPEKREIARELFYDILSMTATNPIVSLIKEKIERREMSEKVSAKVLQATIRNVKTPTQELLKELLDLTKSLESRRHLYNIAIVQLSNLVNKACVNTNSQTNNFPVRIYGLFCKEESQFVTREYIPYLAEKMQQTQKEAQKMVLIAALGKVGHKEILLPMANIIEEQRSNSPMARSLAVYMLKRLAQNEPSTVRPILLALIDNPAENTQVRMAAISVLPWTQPSTADLQKIAVRSWFEPSKQVASFIYTTLDSLVRTEVPELKAVGKKAEGLMNMVKPFQYGIQYSKNTHTKQFIDYLRAASNVETSMVNSEESLAPSRMSLSSHLYGASWEMEGLTIGAYTKGMDWLVDSLWKSAGYKSEVSQQVKEQLEHITEKLRIKKREPQSPASLIYFGVLGYDRIYSLDKEMYNDLINKVSEELMNSEDLFTQGRAFNYTHAKYLIEVDAVGPTASGFPILTSRNVPIVVGIKGHARFEGQMGDKSAMEAKIIPVINAKVQSNMGVISPFTKEFVGAGVDVSVHMTLPLKVKSAMNRKGEFEIKFSSPEEVANKFEALHVFVKPFTVIKSLQSVEPISKAKSIKVIKSERQTEKYERDIGRSLGLKSTMTIESDYPTPYFANVWNIVKKHNLFSLASLSAMPPSVKYGSFKIEFSPRESETKEVELFLSSVYGQKNAETSQLEVSFPSAEEIEISEQKKQEVKQICKEEHPANKEKQEMCENHRIERIAHKKRSHEKIRNLMEQTGSSSVQGMNMQASIMSGSGSKTASTVVLVGTEKQGYRQGKTHAHVAFKAPGNTEYEIDVKAEAEWPENKFRWNIDSILDEPKELNSKIVAVFGKSQESKKEMLIEAKLWKSEDLKRSVQESKEMKKCKDEMEKGRGLASICEEVRHQGSAANKLKVKMVVPEGLRKNWLVEKLTYALANEFLPFIPSLDSVSVQEQNTVEGSMQNGQSSGYEIELTAEVDRKGSAAQIWIQTASGDKFAFKNVTIPQALKGLAPLSLRNGVYSRLVQNATRDQVPASCRLDTRISTFDNKTYDYEFNECEHLLFKDCSGFENRAPLAVLSKKEGDNHKQLRILSSNHIIELKPQGSGRSGQGVEIKVDGQQQEVPFGSPLIKRSTHSGKIILEIVRFHDDVVLVMNPIEGLKVLYDGKKIEIIAPQQLRNRACGLCGDLNGENTADLKSPQECIMSSPRLAAFTYILEGEGQCSGVPSQYREQYEKDLRKCAKKHNVRTPLMKLTKTLLMNKLKQESLVHVVEVQRNQICVSKARVRSCPIGTKPTQTKKEELSFSCFVRTTGQAQQMVKRAMNGDQITELLNYPTSFSKTQFVPTKCERHSSELQQEQTRKQQEQLERQLSQQISLEQGQEQGDFARQGRQHQQDQGKWENQQDAYQGRWENEQEAGQNWYENQQEREQGQGKYQTKQQREQQREQEREQERQQEQELERIYREQQREQERHQEREERRQQEREQQRQQRRQQEREERQQHGRRQGEEDEDEWNTNQDDSFAQYGFEQQQEQQQQQGRRHRHQQQEQQGRGQGGRWNQSPSRYERQQEAEEDQYQSPYQTREQGSQRRSGKVLVF